MHRDWRSLFHSSSAIASAGLVLAALILVALGRLPTTFPISQLAQVGGGGGTYYVSTSGDDANPGSIDQPWKNIERAFDSRADTHMSGGDTLYIRSGEYRYDNGIFVDKMAGWPSQTFISGSAASPTTIAGYPGERPTVYLSDRPTGWQQYEGRPDTQIWKFDWRTYLSTAHPSIYSRGASVTSSAHQWNFVPQIVAIHSGNPTLLQEVNSSENGHSAHLIPEDMNSELEMKSVRSNQDDMIAGDFYYDKGTGFLYVWLPDGSDPNSRPVEVGLSNYFLLSNTLQSYITISNLNFRYSNRSAVTANGNNYLVDNVNSSYNSSTGMSAGKCDSCIFKNSVFSFNGNSGGSLSGEGIVVENSTFERNNYREYAARWHCGGIKVSSGSNMIFRNNTFRDTILCPGLWFDHGGSGQLVERNIFSGPPGSQRVLMFEVTHGTAQNPHIVRNNIFKFTEGIYISSSDYTHISNNLFYEDGGVSIHGIGDGVRTHANNNKFINNIIYMRRYPPNANTESVFIVQDVPAPYSASNNVSDYNIYFPSPDNKLIFGGSMSWGGAFTLAQWQEKGYDLHSKVGDPLLADPANGNYIPRTGSPVIGGGIVSPYVQTDIVGTARTNRNDIGPYQGPPDAIVPEPDPEPTIIPPLTISSVRAVPAITTATIYWSTSLPSTGQVEYGLTAGYGNTSALDTAVITSHSRVLVNLVKNTAYHYRIIARTNTGSTTISSDQVLITENSVQPLVVLQPPVVQPVAQPIFTNNTVVFPETYHPSFSPAASSGVTKRKPVKPLRPLKITRNLKVGDEGEDVRLLQKILNLRGFHVAETGAGSPGQEMDFFNHETKEAVIKYQRTIFPSTIAPSGMLDNLTLRIVNRDIEEYINTYDDPSLAESDPIPQTEGFTISGWVTWLLETIFGWIGWVLLQIYEFITSFYHPTEIPADLL